MPASACSARLRPSKANGLVTTATVRMPRSFAIEATTGAEPVPVPPPSPAVTNTMSAPSITFWRRSRSSRAAFRPISGSEPAPSPAVSRAPSWSLTVAGDERRACRSVLATTKSTPVKSAPIMRLTALDPPPPSPITLILAASRSTSRSTTGCRAPECSIGSSFAFLRERRGRPGGRWSDSSAGPAGGSSPAPDLEEITDPLPHPAAQTPDQRAVGHLDGRRGAVAPRAVPRESDASGVDGALHRVGEPAQPGLHTAAHGHVEDLLGQLGYACHDRRAARQHDPGRRHVLEPGAGEVPSDQREDLLHARLDDLGQDVAR